MTAQSARTVRARSEPEAIDGPQMSEGSVEIELPNQFRLPHGSNRVLVHVILAVRERMLESGRELA